MNLFLMIVSLFLFAHSSAHAIVADEKGKPLKEVVQIFSMVLKQAPEKATLRDLNAIAQKFLLRPKGAERYEPASRQHYQNLLKSLSIHDLKALIDLFRKMGDVDTVFPKSQSFDYILLNGSTVFNMRDRIMFLADLVKNGKIILLAKTQIVFLEGERPLFPTETARALLDPSPYKLRQGWKRPAPLPKDERDAAVLVWDQLELPLELRKHSPLYIHAEKRPGARRAETEDCVLKWVQVYRPQAGTALLISSNPYVYYQLLITDNAISKAKGNQIMLDAVGNPSFQGATYPATSEEMILEAGVMLDNLARVLHNYLILKSLPSYPK